MFDDVSVVADLIRRTAAAEILPRFRNLAPDEVREKKPGDYVTIADERTEAVLTDALLSLAPDTLVVGEEAVASDRSIMDRLKGSTPVWVIDPVDGTGNFVHGRSSFGVILAYVIDGVIEAGWLYQPLTDTMITAKRGQGAWRDGVRLHVDSDRPAAETIGSIYGFSSRRVDDKPVRNEALIHKSGLFGSIENHQCGATEYIAIAEAKMHYSLHSRSLPWDHAAGVLIINEAGGTVRFLDGAPYDPRIADRPILASSSEAVFTTIQGVLLG
jgi:fructose-1,6-bisphosphatase/inositol monophosphatase family enzyme